MNTKVILGRQFLVDDPGTPVKAVYSSWHEKRIAHTSLISGQFTVMYIPGQWAEPVLPGSKLFFYTDLRSAIAATRWVRHPYNPNVISPMGITLWWCDIDHPCNVGFTDVDPPDRKIVAFWEDWDMRFAIGGNPGVLVADRIRLVHLVTEEEILRFCGLTTLGAEV